MESNLDPTERALERTREALQEVKQLLAGEARAVYKESQILSQAERDLETTRDELRTLEQQFIVNERMASIGRLSAGIAHDVNNPVGYILSNLTTVREYLTDLERLLRAQRELLGKAPPELRDAAEALWKEQDAEYLLEDFKKALAESLEGTDRIRKIVTNLREFSNPADGDLRPSDLNEGLEKTILLCWNELKYRTTVHRDFGDLPPVLCRPLRIHQVFTNLLLNAAQAIEKRGEIHVSTRHEDGCAVVRIRDTGIGIPAEHLPHLFRPFFTTKAAKQGTGLGLHVAQKIVAAHGGTIEIASQPNVGTEVTVRLPIQGPPAA
jgi:two-component system, NtrC family, sensor kinase